MEKNLKIDEIAPANPVELMAGWCELFQGLFVVTWCCGIFSLSHTDKWYIVVLGTGLMAGLVWLPGLIISVIFDASREHMAKLSSTYASSKSVFAGGIKYAWKRCGCISIGYASGICVYVTLFLAVAIVIGDVATLFHQEAWLHSLAIGALLSVGGFIVIGARLLYDFVRGTRLKR